MGAAFKIAIVGSGPAGLSAAARAARRGLSYILLERAEHLSDTIQKYQKGKLVMAAPDILPVRADIPFSGGRREIVLESWMREVKAFGANVRLKAEVTAIKKIGDVFHLNVENGDTTKAENVILAIGLQGNINKLDCEGADHPMVQYHLDDPEAYVGKDLVVVGAGDAAIENALALARHNKVTIVNRRDEFTRAKPGNLALIRNAIAKGVIECYPNSRPLRVEANALVLKTSDGETRIGCDRIICRLGASPPRSFAESCGVVFPDNDSSAFSESPAYVSNVPGLYLVGALGGSPLIKQALNQGYEVVEYICDNRAAAQSPPDTLRSLKSNDDCDNRASLLREIQTYFAPDTPSQALKSVVKTAKIRRFSAGQTILAQGEKSSDIHLIRSGSCSVSIPGGDGDIVTGHITAGDFVGEMGLLLDAPHEATVKAIGRTETIQISGQRFKRLMERSPVFKAQIEARFNRRVKEQIEVPPEPRNLLEFFISHGVVEGSDVLFIDETLCIHCDNCEKACAETHDGISRLRRETGPTYAALHVPVSCRHCESAQCMTDCPPNAIHRTPEGEIQIGDNCVGCGNCESNCPYGAIQMAAPPTERFNLWRWLLFGKGPGPGEAPSGQAERSAAPKTAVKCDSCRDVKGGAACVSACPTGAAFRLSPKALLADPRYR